MAGKQGDKAGANQQVISKRKAGEPDRAVEALASVGREALRASHQSQRPTVFGFVAIGLIVLVLGSALIIRGDSLLGTTLAICGLSVIALGIYLSQKILLVEPKVVPSNLRETTPERGAPVPRWIRTVPKMPIKPESVLEDLNRRLRDLRKSAISRIRELRQSNDNNMLDEYVRANIFLPNLDTIEEFGEACSLFIPKLLHDNMNDLNERSIRFGPVEGLTGRVFTRGKIFGASAEPGAKGMLAWHPVALLEPATDLDKGKFFLTDDQVDKINKKLRWIIAFPLQFDWQGTRNTMGVLNIDGLEYQLTIAEMEEVARALRTDVDDVARLLVRLPMCRVSISVEDLSHDGTGSGS